MNKFNPQIHHRRSIRLKGYDYAQAGLYFITICCHNRQCLFGKIVSAKNISPTETVGAKYFSPIEANEKYFSPIEANKKHFSPTITYPQMILNEAGQIAQTCWLEIPEHFPNVILHEYIIMPNHIHGIIELTKDESIQEENNQNMDGQRANSDSPQRSPSKTIGSVIRGFKIGVTKWMRQNTRIHDVWQRNYYENIIRDEQAYLNISNYIINNPAKWAEDKFHQQ